MNSSIRFISLIILLIIVTAYLSLAQNGTVKWRVFNHKNNEPIPFTNIIIDGNLTQGGTSDIDGNFTINNVNPGYVRLVATSVGYRRYDLRYISNSSGTILPSIGIMVDFKCGGVLFFPDRQSAWCNRPS